MSASWASVVAHGLTDNSMSTLETLESLEGASKTLLMGAETYTGTKREMQTSLFSIPNSFLPTLPKSEQMSPLDNVVVNPMPAPFKTHTAMYTQGVGPCAKNRLYSHMHVQGSFAGSVPQQSVRFLDHGTSNRWSIYPTRRHYRELHRPAASPYGLAHMTWQSRRTQPMLHGYGNMLPAKKLQVSNYYPPMRVLVPCSVEQRQPAQPQNFLFGWEQQHCRTVLANADDVQPVKESWCKKDNFEDSWQLLKWDPICKSRQIWDPLDGNQQSRDPSNPKPSPPPGFEHLTAGKRSLSSRARKLMGDFVSDGLHTDYPTPEPMLLPECELREQQHFIAKHDTHLTCGLAQLQVTSGANGDGYYIRPVVKLTSPVSKVADLPKYQPLFYPDFTYWELLRCNREREEQQSKKLTAQTDEEDLWLTNLQAEFNKMVS